MRCALTSPRNSNFAPGHEAAFQHVKLSIASAPLSRIDASPPGWQGRFSGPRLLASLTVPAVTTSFASKTLALNQLFVSERPGFGTNTGFLNGTEGKQGNEGSSLSCGLHESPDAKWRRSAGRRNCLQPRCSDSLLPVLLIREVLWSWASSVASERMRFSPGNAGSHSWMARTDVAVFNRLAERVGYIGCGQEAALGISWFPAFECGENSG